VSRLSAITAAIAGGELSAVKGMGFMLATALFAAVLNTIVRHISTDLHPFEIGFFRAFFGLVFFVPLFLRYGFASLRTKRFPLHLFRAGFTVVSTFCFFWAISLAPLAKVIAINFSGPLFSTVLAVVVLREVIRARRISALVIGFVGALVIFRPGIVEMDLGSILALSAAFTWAFILLAVKMLSTTESAVTITVYSALLASPVAFLACLPFWVTPTLEQLGWLFAIGCLGSMAHLCMVQAFKNADMTIVLPVVFTRLIWVALLGYIFFAEIPDIWTWVGAAMIFSATTYIAFRERKTKSVDAITAPAPPV